MEFLISLYGELLATASVMIAAMAILKKTSMLADSEFLAEASK